MKRNDPEGNLREIAEYETLWRDLNAVIARWAAIEKQRQKRKLNCHAAGGLLQSSTEQNYIRCCSPTKRVLPRAAPRTFALSCPRLIRRRQCSSQSLAQFHHREDGQSRSCSLNYRGFPLYRK